MYPSYPAYFFVAYLLLFLLVPTVWALGGSWRRARRPRSVTCPDGGRMELISLDHWYAVRRHAAGEEDEGRVATCSAWPDRQACGQECLTRAENQ